MKNVYVYVGLLLALICVNQIWADENTEPSAIDAQVERADEPRTKDDGHVSVRVGLGGDDLSDQESLDRIATLVREAAGDEAAQQVLIEFEGMNEDEKAELAEAVRKGFNIQGEHIPKGAVAVAIVAVVMIFGFPVFVLIAVFIYLARKRRQKMNIIQVYLDAGKDVPSELLRNFDSSGGSFRSGLTLTAVGLGIVAAFNAANEPSVGALGLIPLFIGIAKLVYWLFEERKLNKS